MDLSSPKGTNVNNGIDPSLYSVSYVSAEDAILTVLSCYSYFLYTMSMLYYYVILCYLESRMSPAYFLFTSVYYYTQSFFQDLGQGDAKWQYVIWCWGGWQGSPHAQHLIMQWSHGASLTLPPPFMNSFFFRVSCVISGL